MDVEYVWTVMSKQKYFKNLKGKKMSKTIESKTNKPTRVARANKKTKKETVMIDTENKTIETAQVVIPERKGELNTVSINEISLPERIVRMDMFLNKEDGDKQFKTLINSIEKENILIPLTVSKKMDGGYMLIDGFRRLKAAEAVGLNEVPVIVYEDNENKNETLSIISNIHRKKLSPIELAFTYKELIDNGSYATKRELADALGLSEVTVGTSINNIKLDKRIIKDLIENNSVSDQKVLKAIRTLEKVAADTDSSEKQFLAYVHIKDNNLNRKDSLEYIKSQKTDIEIKPITKIETVTKISMTITKNKLSQEQIRSIEKLLAEIEEISNSTIVANAA